MIEIVFKYFLANLLVASNFCSFCPEIAPAIPIPTIEQEQKISIVQQEKEKNIYNLDFIYSLDLTTEEKVSEEELELILEGRKIVEYIPYILQASEENNINIIFLTSLIIWESGWGENPNSYNNLYGWVGGEYSSIEQSILDIAKKIKDMYLSEDGVYYNGLTLESVNINYNGREEWINGMSDIMLMLYQEIDENRKL